jgi:hypothetical protein
MSETGFSRRHFFYGSLLTGAVPAAGFGSTPSLKKAGFKSPSEKLNIASVGAGGKGNSDIRACAVTENIIAMADPDDLRAAKTYALYPNVPKYKDFRRMFDKHEKDIDAVTVSCPDFMHASVAMWAMNRGKHVYCQKPLVRTVWEAQQLRKKAAETGCATQMGNQGYSFPGARECAEIIWSGEIGNVKEVHAWTDRPGHYWPQGPEVDPKPAPTPATLDWQAWLGCSPDREYSPAIAPHHWRGYAAYGCGAIGDMACHILGTPNMAMRLTETGPISVECIKKEGLSKYTFPHLTVIRFDFPARGPMPALSLYWHDSLKSMPKFDGVPEGEQVGDDDINGSIYLGDKGIVTTGCYGENTRLLPNARMKDYKLPPQLLQRSPEPFADPSDPTGKRKFHGHYRDWLRAAKGGAPACSNFSVSAPFVSWMLLGVIAMQFEGKLEWDAKTLQITNNKAANALLTPVFRKGWQFNG